MAAEILTFIGNNITDLAADEECAGTGLWINPETVNMKQLVFLTVVYGMVLYQASGLIADGSELLLFVPSVAGLVGSIVLPILGAVPDGLIVLFSGLGADAQAQVSVGMGAQAGSTVMLLTFPWFIAIYFGAVPIKNGEADYGKKTAKRQSEGSVELPASGPIGVSFEKSIHKNTYIMLMTTLLFFVIQIPASISEAIYPSSSPGDSGMADQASHECKWAMCGLIACVLGFCGYLVYCYRDANEDKNLALLIEGIQNHQVSLGAALKFICDTMKQNAPPKDASNEGLLKRKTTEKQELTTLRTVLKPFFAKYDYNGDGGLEKNEVKPLLLDLNLKPSEQNIAHFFASSDRNNDMRLTFDEFVVAVYQDYMVDDSQLETLHDHANPKFIPSYGDDEEEEEIPEELVDQNPATQMRNIIAKSVKMMGAGTFLVVMFSDPMVDVLNNWGTRLNVSPFYIAFIVAPFASNASELLAAMNYAQKKTKSGITTALSTLVGAACMNNTFCLSIFLALVYAKGLAWEFTAETICCVVAQWVIGFLTLKSTTQTMTDAYIILGCYPLCLFGVWFLENILLWD